MGISITVSGPTIIDPQGPVNNNMTKIDRLYKVIHGRISAR